MSTQKPPRPTEKYLNLPCPPIFNLYAENRLTSSRAIIPSLQGERQEPPLAGLPDQVQL